MKETRQGLEKMGSHPDDPAFEESIELLDQEIAATEDLIKSRKDDIEETLNLVEDLIARTALRLRFLCGMSWKEVGYLTNFTDKVVVDRSIRAMNKHIPK